MQGESRHAVDLARERPAKEEFGDNDSDSESTRGSEAPGHKMEEYFAERWQNKKYGL